MASKRIGNSDEEHTSTTTEDLLREISSKLDELKRLDSIDQHLVALEKRIDQALRRDQVFEGRFAKLEMRLTKVEKKLG